MTYIFKKNECTKNLFLNINNLCLAKKNDVQGFGLTMKSGISESHYYALNAHELILTLKQKEHMGIFEKRVSLKPYEYTQLYSFVDAIRNSYWIHTEFNFTSDIQDFKTWLTENERQVVTRTLLAIAQIEVDVKSFWKNIDRHIPKPEVDAVWVTFAESEARHMDAYAHLLEILWLNEMFYDIESIPAIKGRIDYLNKSKEWKGFIKQLLLFSLFVEHISLFSQFLIVMAFNKHRNVLKGTSNVIEATSKEENIHGMFGAELINIIRKEHPEMFTKELKSEVYEMAQKALTAEIGILDWIFEDGQIEFLPKKTITTFIQNRFNNSLESIGYSKLFHVDEGILENTEWFEDELNATKHGDFFVKKSVNYNKKNKSITEDDLF